MQYATRLRCMSASAGFLLAGASLVAGPMAAATAALGSPLGKNYVALGSSYAAGANVGTSDPTDIGGVCGRTTSSYPRLVADTLGLRLTNAACGGATIDNIAKTPQVTGETNPHAVELQINAVISATDLVTITVGVTT